MMKKLFIIIFVVLFFKYPLYGETKVYSVSFPQEGNGDASLLIRNYKILARYYAVLELKKEIKDFAYLAIDDINYEGFDGKHNFSVVINTEIFKENGASLDDELIEILEILLKDWESLSKLDVKSITGSLIKKYESELAIIDIIRSYDLHTKVGRAFIKSNLREIEKKVRVNLDERDIKTILLLSYLYLKAGYGIKSEELLTSAVNNYPDSFILNNRYAVILKEMGKFDDAIREFESHIERFGNPLSLFYLGMTFKNKEDCIETVKKLNNFIKLAEDNYSNEKVIARNAINECQEGLKSKKKSLPKNKRRKK